MEQVVAVFGGSGGIGGHITRRISRDARVVIGYRSKPDVAQTLADEINSQGGKAAALQVDVTDGESVAAFYDKATAQFGRIHAVVSATGPVFPIGPLVTMTEQDFRSVLNVDVVGSFNILRHGIPLLAAQGGGAFVLTLTSSVQRTYKNNGLSNVPKIAVSGLIRQAARENGHNNIRINGIAPGVVDAGMAHDAIATVPYAAELIADCLSQTPLGRMARPEEVGELAAYLTSDAAAYVSGQIIGVDGGFSS